MIENINLNKSTVTAELEGYMYDGLFNYHGVFKNGNQIGYEVVSNNEIKLKDGLLCNRNRFMRIVGTESVVIENGTSGVARTDLIVAHFETDGINESHDIRVIKGSAGGAVPSHRSDDIYDGGTVSDLVLYQVNLNGLNIESVEAKFEVLPSLSEIPELKTEVASMHQDLLATMEKTSQFVNAYSKGTGTAIGTYVKFARIKTNASYLDTPIKIELSQRTYRAGDISIVFQNGESSDPSLLRFSVRAWSGCNAPEVYLHKSGTSTWDLYVHKPSNYDYVNVHRAVLSPYLGDWRVTIDWLDEEVATLPDGYIEAQAFDGNVRTYNAVDGDTTNSLISKMYSGTVMMCSINNSASLISELGISDASIAHVLVLFKLNTWRFGGYFISQKAYKVGIPLGENTFKWSTVPTASYDASTNTLNFTM